MWKDFFSFTKRERLSIVALTLLILLVQVLIWTKDSWVRFLPENLEAKYRQKKELEAFRDSVTAQKPTFAAQERSMVTKTKAEPLTMLPFNPNTADSMTLCRLGLRSYVVKNILQYRRKGGTFRKKADFSRIYGMDPALFAKLEPLIQLEQPSPVAKTGALDSAVKRVAIASSSQTNQSLPPNLQDTIDHIVRTAVQHMESAGNTSGTFELNSTDTALLQQLKGVGSYTANRVTRYRNQLGGFYSMSQLSEIKGLYPETLERLQTMFKIDPSRITGINVNKASLEKLRAHPYLSFYQAKVIVELRKARGLIHTIEELKTFKEFKPEDLDRLQWYLRF